jgi:hypothetical protein
VEGLGPGFWLGGWCAHARHCSHLGAESWAGGGKKPGSGA